MEEMSCFKAYDVRGKIGLNFDEAIAYRIGRAVAQFLNVKSTVIGFDARETSPKFADAVSKGVRDAGSDVIKIGMAGTEEMYWAVTEFSAGAGIQVTASHNPINYNGLKIVKASSRPLEDESEFQMIKVLATSQEWSSAIKTGLEFDRADDARRAYVSRVLSFINLGALKPLKIVVNSGNGAAGPTFDAIAQEIKSFGAPLDFIRVNHAPDATFPNGIPNPLLSENHAVTADAVKSEAAHFGVAFDGDFDRCFFFDEFGRFVPGEYMSGILASMFVEKESNAKIIHDGRVVWNIQDITSSAGAVAIQSKTGHAFMKQAMRKHNAIYGGEISAHHYFRDFAYSDSGMIPWLLISELVSRSGRSLGDWVTDRLTAFPSSGEKNFRVRDTSAAVDKVLHAFRKQATHVDFMDGISLSFDDWRFNLRRSNTEPLLRLNVEGRGGRIGKVEDKVNEISILLDDVAYKS